jgi:uncharacterized membrane protein required for colicin V production
MRPEFIPSVSWVDAVIILMLILGLRRGLARGISEEVFDLFKWLAGLALAGCFYLPLGDFMADGLGFPPRHFWHLAVYVGLVAGVRVPITFLHDRYGHKLLTSDFFGKAEYGLGTLAGACRYACIVLVCLAVFNGHYYTPEEIQNQVVAQENLFGSAPFPTTGTMQHEIFEASKFGSAARHYLPMLLIQAPTAEGNQSLHAGVGWVREQEVYEILEKR